MKKQIMSKYEQEINLEDAEKVYSSLEDHFRSIRFAAKESGFADPGDCETLSAFIMVLARLGMQKSVIRQYEQIEKKEDTLSYKITDLTHRMLKYRRNF